MTTKGRLAFIILILLNWAYGSFWAFDYAFDLIHSQWLTSGIAIITSIAMLWWSIHLYRRSDGWDIALITVGILATLMSLIISLLIVVGGFTVPGFK